MVRRCFLVNCGLSERRSGPSVSYHRLPRDDTLLAAWRTVLQNFGETIPAASSRTYICSRHFRVGDFLLTGKGKQLRASAVPSAECILPNEETPSTGAPPQNNTEMAFQVIIKSEPDPIHEEPTIKVEDLSSATPTGGDPLLEPFIKLEELSPPAASPGPSTSAPKKTHLKPIKTKICIKKADTRQCRLCLRVLARKDVRETTAPGSDLRRKIMDAVAVKITVEDKVKTVCINRLLLVDMIYEFRVTCKKSNTLHAVKLLMMHPGSWMSEENKNTIEACHRVVKKNRAEMDGLFKCSWVGGGPDVKEFRNMSQDVLLDGGDAPKVREDEISDSDPEMSEEFGKQMDQDAHQDSIEASSDEDPPPAAKKVDANRIMCDICGSLINKTNEEHHRNKHAGVKPYSCNLEGCEATFYSQRAMVSHCSNEQHMSTAEQHKPIQCTVCHRMIKNKNMRAHMWAQHSDKPVHPLKKQCPVCGKYYYKLYIKDHMATHTGELPHGCEFCDRRFAAYNNLMIHKRKYHSEQLESHATGKSYHEVAI